MKCFQMFIQGDKTFPKDLKNLEVYLMALKRPSKSKFRNAEL